MIMTYLSLNIAVAVFNGPTLVELLFGLVFAINVIVSKIVLYNNTNHHQSPSSTTFSVYCMYLQSGAVYEAKLTKPLI